MTAPAPSFLDRVRWVAAAPLLAVSVWLGAGSMAASTAAEVLAGLPDPGRRP